MTNDEVNLEEFKLVVEAGRDYFAFYLKAVILYFAIVGVLVKAMLDAQHGSDDRLVFWVAGILVHIWALVASVYALRLYTTLSQRCDALARSLGVPNVYFGATTGTARMFTISFAVIGLGWSALATLL
jgi:hypothetical protein